MQLYQMVQCLLRRLRMISVYQNLQRMLHLRSKMLDGLLVMGTA